MLTCLEILNILYIKCTEMCGSIKFKFNTTFDDRRHRPYPYTNTENNIYSTRYSKDFVIDMDRQILVETVSGPVFLKDDGNIIEKSKMTTIEEELPLNTFSTESKIEGDYDGDWSIIMDDSN